jgi:hypothetical protein
MDVASNLSSIDNITIYGSALKRFRPLSPYCSESVDRVPSRLMVCALHCTGRASKWHH